jgi:exopolysaccharide biosynthesis protein
MKKTVLLVLSLFLAAGAFAQWTPVTDGVQYQRFQRGSMDAHVVKIDVSNPKVRLLASREEDRGLTVSAFAKKNKAIVAINGDYFDKAMRTIGLSAGPCGVRDQPQDQVRREAVVAIGKRRAAIFAPRTPPTSKPKAWMTGVVAGWPLVVRHCRAFTASELPGSDFFTRAPHPRTAVGMSADWKTMYWVVADGRRKEVPGLTLAELGTFMDVELGVCSAVNLDGGGSSTMWLRDRVVNEPSEVSEGGIDGERAVSNHLAIVAPADYPACRK